MTTHSMSYFHAPVATYTGPGGRTVFASLRPVQDVTLAQVYQLIAADGTLRRLTEEVRSTGDLGEAKKRLLPYVTPFGTFSRRNSRSLLRLSGLLPVDIDKLGSPEEAAGLRDRIAADRFLTPALAFVSPSGKGVKLFLPFSTRRIDEGNTSLADLFRWTAVYIRALYGYAVDESGKDLARACFLCHDPGAKVNLYV